MARRVSAMETDSCFPVTLKMQGAAPEDGAESAAFEVTTQHGFILGALTESDGEMACAIAEGACCLKHAGLIFEGVLSGMLERDPEALVIALAELYQEDVRFRAVIAAGLMGAADAQILKDGPDDPWSTATREGHHE